MPPLIVHNSPLADGDLLPAPAPSSPLEDLAFLLVARVIPTLYGAATRIA